MEIDTFTLSLMLLGLCISVFIMISDDTCANGYSKCKIDENNSHCMPDDVIAKYPGLCLK